MQKYKTEACFRNATAFNKLHNKYDTSETGTSKLKKMHKVEIPNNKNKKFVVLVCFHNNADLSLLNFNNFHSFLVWSSMRTYI